MHRSIVAFTFVLAACSAADAPGTDAGVEDASITDATTPDGTAPDAMVIDAGPDVVACTLASPYSSQNATCNDCAEAKCCPQINGCLLDPDCNDGYVNCALGCALDPGDAGTDPCLADCEKQFPTGKIEYDNAIGCADEACAVECQ
ncbi:Hypothetical protein A7982_05317 [Minicystis rosea]|nr:Hypothetical protein A7982_05317 [Minicystis rosea]